MRNALTFILVFLGMLHCSMAACQEAGGDAYLLVRLCGGGGILQYINIRQDPSPHALLENIDCFDVSRNGERIVFRKKGSDELNYGRIIDKNHSLSVESEAISGLSFTKNDGSFVLSYDGKWLAWVNDHGANDGRSRILTSSLNVVCINDKKQFKSYELKGQGLCPSWSPDGKRIAFYLRNLPAKYSICHVDLLSSEIKQFPPSLETRLTSIRDWAPLWSDDSKFFICEGRYSGSQSNRLIIKVIDNTLTPCPDVYYYWSSNSEIFIADPRIDSKYELHVYKCSVAALLSESQVAGEPVGIIDEPIGEFVFSSASSILFFCNFKTIWKYDFKLQKKTRIAEMPLAPIKLVLICK